MLWSYLVLSTALQAAFAEREARQRADMFMLAGAPQLTALAWPSLPPSAPIIEEPDTIILHSSRPMLSDWIFFDILP